MADENGLDAIPRVSIKEEIKMELSEEMMMGGSAAPPNEDRQIKPEIEEEEGRAAGREDRAEHRDREGRRDRDKERKSKKSKRSRSRERDGGEKRKRSLVYFEFLTKLCEKPTLTSNKADAKEK